MKLRPFIENPFRNYAVFSGRAGRAEFWLFVLTFIVITQLAWLLGFGAMKIAGFDRGHDNTTPHQLMGQTEYNGAVPGDNDNDNDNGQSASNQSVKNKQSDGAAKADGESRATESRATPDHKDLSPDRHQDDMLNFMIHRHGGDGYHLHGIMRDDHIFSYDPEGLDDEDDHERYAYRGYHRDKYDDKHIYVRFHKSRAERGGDILWIISVAALLLPLLAVGSRRLHDSNHSGWWQLLALIPIAGWLVLTVFFLLQGEEEANRFGAPSDL